MCAGFTPVILFHTAAALAALALGALVFTRRKGSASHRLLGRTWVALMLATATSSFWIQSHGNYSWIHGLSVLVIVGLGGPVYCAVSVPPAHHERPVRGRSRNRRRLHPAAATPAWPHALVSARRGVKQHET